ncbi:MAG: hypothetical protein LBH59_05065 [Planctomycetaceae bacterium]|nr:hypothetical protein [Planctomycetaceae bacterium]
MERLFKGEAYRPYRLRYNKIFECFVEASGCASLQNKKLKSNFNCLVYDINFHFQIYGVEYVGCIISGRLHSYTSAKSIV